jgi:hypothetical protein
VITMMKNTSRIITDEGNLCTMEAATYSMLFLCSEKTRRMNSPSSLGSNVEGTMQYTPGGNLKRQFTSRRLIKDGDRATDALYLKKLRSRGFGTLSGSCSCHKDKHLLYVPHQIDCFYINCKGSLVAKRYTVSLNNSLIHS